MSNVQIKERIILYKKVLLIVSASDCVNKEIIRDGVSAPHLGILYIASILKLHDYEVEVIDLLVENLSKKQFIDIVKECKPDLVGISSFTEDFNTTLEIAKAVKTINNRIKIVLGGPHATFESKNILLNSEVDYIIRFEGEFPLLLLLEHLNNPAFSIKNVKNLAYKEEGEIIVNEDYGFIKSLDALPFPSYDLIDFSKYLLPFTLITSRGCPGNCVYCSSRTMSGNTFRFRSAENIICEIIYMKNKTNWPKFVIFDDSFTVNKKRVKRFCEIYRQLDLSLPWRCESRADVLSTELIDILYNSGCSIIHIGIESGNQNVINSIRKKIDLSKAIEAAIYAKRKGMEVVCSFIIGHHCDTKDTIIETLELMKKFKSEGIIVSVAANTPFPGTFLYEHREELGIKLHARDWKDYKFSIVNVSNNNLTVDELRSYLFEGVQVCIK